MDKLFEEVFAVIRDEFARARAAMENSARLRAPCWRQQLRARRATFKRHRGCRDEQRHLAAVATAYFDEDAVISDCSNDLDVAGPAAAYASPLPPTKHAGTGTEQADREEEMRVSDDLGRCIDDGEVTQGKAALSLPAPLVSDSSCDDAPPIGDGQGGDSCTDQYVDDPVSSLVRFNNIPVYDVDQAEQQAESRSVSFEMGQIEVEQWQPVREKANYLELEPDLVINMASSPVFVSPVYDDDDDFSHLDSNLICDKYDGVNVCVGIEAEPPGFHLGMTANCSTECLSQGVIIVVSTAEYGFDKPIQGTFSTAMPRPFGVEDVCADSISCVVAAHRTALGAPSSAAVSWTSKGLCTVPKCVILFEVPAFTWVNTSGITSINSQLDEGICVDCIPWSAPISLDSLHAAESYKVVLLEHSVSFGWSRTAMFCRSHWLIPWIYLLHIKHWTPCDREMLQPWDPGIYFFQCCIEVGVIRVAVLHSVGKYHVEQVRIRVAAGSRGAVPHICSGIAEHHTILELERSPLLNIQISMHEACILTIGSRSSILNAKVKIALNYWCDEWIHWWSIQLPGNIMTGFMREFGGGTDITSRTAITDTSTRTDEDICSKIQRQLNVTVEMKATSDSNVLTQFTVLYQKSDVEVIQSVLTCPEMMAKRILTLYQERLPYVVAVQRTVGSLVSAHVRWVWKPP